jgi:tRNA(fMet)-specific endonuclease VapC
LDDDELAIALVSVAEYRVGIEMADTASGAAERAMALVAITSAVDDYTQPVGGLRAAAVTIARQAGASRARITRVLLAGPVRPRRQRGR